MAPKMRQVLAPPPVERRRLEWSPLNTTTVLCDRWLDSTREIFQSRRRLIEGEKIGHIFIYSLVDQSVYLDVAECLM